MEKLDKKIDSQLITAVNKNFGLFNFGESTK